MIYSQLFYSLYQEEMKNYLKSNNVQALSIYAQIHNRKNNQDCSKTQHKHLLGLLSSFPREEENDKNQTQVVEDLCCFDRMKKIINHNDASDSVQQKQDIMNAIALEQKINQLELKLSKSSTNKVLLKPSKPSSTHFMRRSCIIDEMKRGCIQKLFEHKQQIKKKKQQQIKRIVDRQIDGRVDNMIQEKSMQYEKLQKETEQLKKTIYVKELQIQGLKMKETYLRQYIAELHQKCNGKTQAKKPSSNERTNFQNFYEKYMEVFDGMTIDQLKYKLQVSVNKCLNEFQRIQNKNYQNMKEQITNQQNKCQKLQQKIKKLQIRENELINNIKNSNINKEISEIQVNQLIKGKQQLGQMQKLIVSIYNSWYADRSESEKKLMKETGQLSQNYSYEEMLNYILQFSKNFSTNQRLNRYLYKILRGVQRIRRVLWPDLPIQHVDSLLTIQKIQKWVKLKQSQYGRKVVKKRTQQNSGKQKQNYYEIDF